MPSKILGKFTCILDIHKYSHAKIQLNSSSTSIENKIKKMHKAWHGIKCNTSKDHVITLNPGTQKLQTTYQNDQENVWNMHKTFHEFLMKHQDFMSKRVSMVHKKTYSNKP